jgi:hypothetical protein
MSGGPSSASSGSPPSVGRTLTRAGCLGSRQVRTPLLWGVVGWPGSPVATRAPRTASGPRPPHLWVAAPIITIATMQAAAVAVALATLEVLVVEQVAAVVVRDRVWGGRVPEITLVVPRGSVPRQRRQDLGSRTRASGSRRCTTFASNTSARSSITSAPPCSTRSCLSRPSPQADARTNGSVAWQGNGFDMI